MRKIPVLFAALLVSACSVGEKMKTAGDSAFSGRYTLVSLDGMTIPATISHAGAVITLNSGLFTINNDGTCRSKTVFVPPEGREVSREVRCSYKKDGSRLNMDWEGAGRNTGVIDGDTFTMHNEDMVFVYRKQAE